LGKGDNGGLLSVITPVNNRIRFRTGVVLCVLLAAAIFAFDVMTPLGVAGGVPYVAVVLIGLMARRPRTVLVLAALGTALTVVGYFISPGAVSPHSVVLINRGLAIFAIWATGIVSYIHLRSLATLKPLVYRDELTGIFNRHYFNEETEKLIQASRRYGYPLSLIMLDIDWFKDINDKWGHLAGDRVLKALAEALHEQIRDIDTICRFGGEEFVVLLPYTDLQGAVTTAHHLQRTITALSVSWNEATIKIQVSMGVAELTPDQHSVADLVGTADQALYQAKSNGRNRIETAPARS